MFDKLRQIEERWGELNHQLADPTVMAQPALYARTAKAASELSDAVQRIIGLLERVHDTEDAFGGRTIRCAWRGHEVSPLAKFCTDKYTPTASFDSQFNSIARIRAGLAYFLSPHGARGAHYET